ncbi:MAG: hypothetical protein M1482_08945 [Chloroflexi bacterium]|nr:hypothetical protein [Chloroflexota bacterium]
MPRYKESGREWAFTYWQDNGWLDPRRTCYAEEHTSRLKVSLARLVGAAIAPLFA